MTASMRFVPSPGRMKGQLRDAAALPGESFELNIPEMIGDAAQLTAEGSFGKIDWIEWAPGRWTCTAQATGECSYQASMDLSHDTADIRIRLINESTRVWDRGAAFDHFGSSSSPLASDFEAVRHWVRVDGAFRRLHELPRKYSGRPGVQVFNVLDAPPVSQIPFANNFHATPSFTAEGWLAMQSRDGTRLLAMVAKPALFLFQNSEFTCIHSAPDFGRLAPGEWADTQTRIYIVESTLEDWYQRMRDELFP